MIEGIDTSLKTYHKKVATVKCPYCGRDFTPYMLDGRICRHHCHSIRCMKEHQAKTKKKPKIKVVPKAIVTATPKEQMIVNTCRVCKRKFTSKKEEDLCGSPMCVRKIKSRRTDRIYNLLYPRLLEDHFEEPKEVIIRECLKCEKPFESSGNRICPKCSDSNKQIMEWQ